MYDTGRRGCRKHITTIEGLKVLRFRRLFLKKRLPMWILYIWFIINSYALLEKHPDADDEIAKEWLKSNLCRCTGYEGIKNSIHSTRKR